MTSRHIVMDFTTPPGLEDILAIAEELAPSLPAELTDNIEKLCIEVEDFPDEFIMDELNADTPFDLLGVYISTNFLSGLPPHIQAQVLNSANTKKKRKPSSRKEDILRLYRRPILDAWSETQDHLTDLIRHVMIREISYHFEFSEDDIADMEQDMQNIGDLELLAV